MSKKDEVVERPTNKRSISSDNESVVSSVKASKITTGLACLDTFYGPDGIIRPSINRFVDGYRVNSLLLLQVSSWLTAQGFKVLFISYDAFTPGMNALREKTETTALPQIIYKSEGFDIIKEISEIKPDVVFLDSWNISQEYEDLDGGIGKFARDLKELSQRLCLAIFISCHRNGRFWEHLVKYCDSSVTMNPANHEVYLMVSKIWGDQADSKCNCTLARTAKGLVDIADVKEDIDPPPEEEDEMKSNKSDISLEEYLNRLGAGFDTPEIRAELAAMAAKDEESIIASYDPNWKTNLP